MTTSSVAIVMVTWEELNHVLRMAFPKVGKYGDVSGCDATLVLRVLRDDDQISRIAQGIWDARAAHRAATAAARDTIDAADKVRMQALRELADSIRASTRAPNA